MTNLRSLSLCALAGALLSCVALAQSAAPAARIVSSIDANHLITLRGNVNPHATPENDRGPVSAGFAMPDLTLVLSRSQEQQAAFDAYVNSEYDPGSPNYHHWLTPGQIGDQFGPAPSDIAAITGWLASQGFNVTSVASDRMTIRFSGSAGQVQNAFHTQIHNLLVGGVAHYANMTDPQIPAALAPVVIGVKSLQDFLPHPLHHVGGQVQFNKEAGRWQRVSIPAAAITTSAGTSSALPAPSMQLSGIKPQFGYTGTSGGSPYLQEDLAPYDFATIYNLLPLWNASTPINGTGQTIAIAGTSDINLSDVATFRSLFGLPAGLTPKQINTNTYAKQCTGTSGYCTGSDLLENTLDVEWSGATAPGAQVDLVVTGQPTSGGSIDTVYASAEYVIQNVSTLGARILSVSYGACELGEGTAGNVAYNNLWQSAAAEGISVFVATGDSGAPACDQGGDSIGLPYSAYYGLSVNGLASTPYNTAVGGTDFTWCKPVLDSSGNLTGCPTSTSQAGPYWKTSNSTQQASAAGYVPEAAWNDSCDNPIWAKYLESIAPLVGATVPSNAEAACNFVEKNYGAVYSQYQVMLAPFIDTAGAGGGASSCVVNSTDPNGSAIGTCSSSSTSTGSSYGSLTLYNDGWVKPTWQTGVSGIPSDGVRDIPDISFFAGDGNLGSATLVCASAYSGTACSTSNVANGSLTELGGTSVATPEMAGIMALINQKAGAPQGNPNSQLYSIAAKQTYSSCSAESVTANSASCYFNDVDSGTIGMPCDYGAAEGGVQYSSSGGWTVSQTIPGIQSPNCAALNTGDTIGTLIQTGSTNKQAYDAVVGYDLATGLGSMNVANVVNAWTAIAAQGTATATVAITPASTSLNSNVSLNVTVKVSGSSGTPTGQVVLASNSVYSAAGTPDGSGSYTFTIPAYTFAATGTVTLTANYGGDSNYAAATATQTISVTYVPPPTYSIGKITNPSAISSAGGSATATATVSTSNGYSGTVTLSCTLSGAPTNAVSLPTCTSTSPSVALSSTTTSGNVQFTIKTTAATASLTYPRVGKGKGWLGAGSGAVLALLLFFGIPARRKSWQTMLGMLVLLAALGSMAACGGGGGGGSNGGNGGGTGTPGTTVGTYTFTVSGSANPSVSPAPASQTFTVTVN